MDDNTNKQWITITMTMIMGKNTVPFSFLESNQNGKFLQLSRITLIRIISIHDM